MNQNNDHIPLRPSSRRPTASQARHPAGYHDYLFQQENTYSDLESGTTVPPTDTRSQALGAPFQHYPSGNDPTFSSIGPNPAIYDYPVARSLVAQHQPKLEYAYQFNQLLSGPHTLAQPAHAAVYRSPVQNLKIPSQTNHRMSPSYTASHVSPNQAAQMTPVLRMPQVVSLGQLGPSHVSSHGSPQITSHGMAGSVHRGMAHGISHVGSSVMRQPFQEGSPATQVGHGMLGTHSNPHISALQHLNELAPRKSVRESGGSPHFAFSEDFSGDLQEHSINSELQNRKRARIEGAEDFESTLKALTAKVGPLPLGDLASKIKVLESNDLESKSDPLVASLINSRDTKQELPLHVFAMSWVQQSCEISHTSVVPRDRIYARYVQLCATFKLHPLAPGNLGRVLRVFFPNLKTRRLGMRGKSKYHYCGIKLIGDQSQSGSPMSSYSFGLDSPQSLNPQTPPFAGSPSVSTPSGTPFASLQVQEYFKVVNLKYLPTLFNDIEKSMANDFMNQPLNIPSIYSYLQKDDEVDYDIADTLQSLYTVHCTSVFELLRYMQVEKMFGMTSPFTSVLSAPVIKLFTSENTLEWVKACDMVMYRSMLKMLTRLHLLTLPDEIMQPLKEVARNYVNKLSESFTTKFPRSFRMMKLAVARQFVQILKRLIKCIETGASAAKILSNSNERTVMLDDWLQLDMHEIVMREVPCALDNSETLIDTLDTKLVRLFEDGAQLESPVLKPYASFLFELPSKFSRLNPWLFTLVCSNLITTCLREMSLSGATSFGSWWVVRCWVDEYLSWCLELGGFLYDEFGPDFEANAEEEHERPISANVTTSLETGDGQEQGKAASLVDLLDGLQSEMRTHYHDSEWLR